MFRTGMSWGGSSKAGGKDGRSGWEFLRGALGTLGRYSRQYRSLIEPMPGWSRAAGQFGQSVQSNSRQSAKLGGALEVPSWTELRQIGGLGVALLRPPRWASGSAAGISYGAKRPPSKKSHTGLGLGQHLQQPGGFDAQAAAGTTSSAAFPPPSNTRRCHSTLGQLRRQPGRPVPYNVSMSVSVVRNVNVSVTEDMRPSTNGVSKQHPEARRGLHLHIPESFHGSGCTPTATL